MAVEHRQVGMSIQLRIDELGPKPGEGKAGRGESRAGSGVFEQAAAPLPVQGAPLAMKIGDEQVPQVVVIRVIKRDPHARLAAAVAIKGQAAHHGLLRKRRLVAAAGLIDIEEVRSAVVGDKQTQATFSLKIGDEHSPGPCHCFP